MSETKYYPFVAAIKRENEPVRYKPKCTVYEGYLVTLESRKNSKGIWTNKFIPIFNSVLLGEADKIRVREIKDVTKIIGTPDESLLIKFGKHDDLKYWVWNQDATDKKKLEENKTVYGYEKKDMYEDEGDLRISKKNYPSSVKSIIEKHSTITENYYEIHSFSELEKELKTIDWKLIIK